MKSLRMRWTTLTRRIIVMSGQALFRERHRSFYRLVQSVEGNTRTYGNWGRIVPTTVQAKASRMVGVRVRLISLNFRSCILWRQRLLLRGLLCKRVKVREILLTLFEHVPVYGVGIIMATWRKIVI